MKKIFHKTPQNIKDSLKEIGELSTLFYLYSCFNLRGWSVYRNYDESGYDILLFNESKNKRIKIEVKTRQRIVSSQTDRKTTHFTLSENEWKKSNFIVALWFEFNKYFIVPTSALKQTRSGSKKLYKFIVTINQKGEVSDNAKKYLDNWESIIQL